MKWISLSLILFFCLPVHTENLGLAPLDPDYESRFYSIYKNHHSRQMSITEWQELISRKNINTYTMQKGDNLWDISRMLFNNANHWPKLWSVNADLSNPHRISVGYKVQVIMGSEGQAPRAVINPTSKLQTSVSKGKTDGLPQQEGEQPSLAEENFSSIPACVKDLGLILHKEGSTKVYDSIVKCKVLQKKLRERKIKDSGRLKNYYTKQLQENEEIGLKPFIPPGRLGVIPKSMPPIQLTPVKDIDLERLGRNLSVSHSNVVVAYQVDIDDIDIVGNIFDVPDGISTPTSEIIVELDVPAQKGELFSVIRPMRKLRKPSLFISGPVGHELVLQARVKITDSVPNREGLYFVEVMNMYNTVNENSKIIREAPSIFDFQSRMQSGQTRAQITALSADQSSLALTVHSFIYVNRGKNNNVNVGEVFNVQANPRFHERSFGKPLGRVVIVHTAGDFSTGFVTHLNGVAYPGDYLEPLDSAGYISDSEEDDIYEAEEESYEEDEEEDEEEEFAQEGSYEEDEEEEFTEEGSYEEDEEEENTALQEQPVDSLEDGVVLEEDSRLEEGTDEPSTDEFVEEDETEPTPLEEDVSGESQEESFLDDFEDEELEWDEE